MLAHAPEILVVVEFVTLVVLLSQLRPDARLAVKWPSRSDQHAETVREAKANRSLLEWALWLFIVPGALAAGFAVSDITAYGELVPPNDIIFPSVLGLSLASAMALRLWFPAR